MTPIHSVFTGDNRPTMMARGQIHTYYDPESLQRPVSQNFGPPPTLARQNSKGKTLLNFDDEAAKSEAGRPPNARTQTSRSVFGTDKLWEREMAKLKIIEADEKEAKEAEEKRAAAEAARGDKTKKKKGKGKGKAKAESVEEDDAQDLGVPMESAPRVSTEPPMLPILRDTTIRGPPPPVNDDDTESDSEDSAHQAPARREARRGSAETAANRWVAESSDEEGPRRTPGVGLRYPNPTTTKSQPVDDDSEEDMPLAATVNRALHRVMSSGGDDSDEDVPLAAMLDKTKPNIPPVNFDSLSGEQNADDDQPLGLRASRVPLPHSSFGLSSQAGDADEDDVPLALHPDQQRRTQYMAMAQQQQMMMQAQMQQSMFFGPPAMMASGFFGPPMGAMPMMSPPVPQPPAQEVNKFGRVDKWRRDVAVEGQP